MVNTIPGPQNCIPKYGKAMGPLQHLQDRISLPNLNHSHSPEVTFCQLCLELVDELLRKMP